MGEGNGSRVGERLDVDLSTLGSGTLAHAAPRCAFSSVIQRSAARTVSL